MKRKTSFKSRLKKVNISTIFFFVLSLISSTFAWFAYSNVVDSNISVEVKSWDIDITEDNSEIAQLVNINIDSFSPGIETYTKNIKIKNNGDLPAYLDFEIVSLRILEDTYSGEDILDSLSHDYPFFFNFVFNTNYITTNQTADFDISIGWPLDSGDNVLDTTWGSNAYEFYHNEQVNLANDPSYTVRPCISLVVKLESRQYVAEEDINASEVAYRHGTAVTFNNIPPHYVINKDVKKTDGTLDAYRPRTDAATFTTSNVSGCISANDVVDLISIDINNTYIINENISNRVLGTIQDSTRLNNLVNELISSSSSVSFDSNKFSYLTPTTTCYWTKTSINDTYAYAIKKTGGVTMLYPERKTTSCYLNVKATFTKDCTYNQCI